MDIARIPGHSVHQIFEHIAIEFPLHNAIIINDCFYTYQQLNEKSNQLAQYLLVNYNIKPYDIIGILSEPSEWIIISILAILKCGAAYMPLSPKFPQDRLSYMVDNADMGIIIGMEKLLDKVDNNINKIFISNLNHAIRSYPTTNINIQTSPEDVAYIMYTSGTTGKPNGVEIPHRGILRLVYQANYFPYHEPNTFIQLSPLSFDASTFEIWGALLNGNCLVLYPDSLFDIMIFKNVVAVNSISCIFLTTALFNLIVDESPETFLKIRYILTGGEVMSINHIQKVMEIQPDLKIFNVYGPTECTTFSSYYLIPKPLDLSKKSIPIGKPIDKTQLLILNEDLTITESGQIGELHIGGEGLALRYRKQPLLTEEKFIKNPFSDDSSDLIYKTGDLCRILPSGDIDFVGRKDFQVKIKGFRIETQEIESIIKTNSVISNCLVITSKGDLTTELIAYIIGTNKLQNMPDATICHTIDVKKLKFEISEWLPEFMIPKCFIELNKFPLNINGKIDRSRLPLPEETIFDNDEISVLTDTEQKLKNCWNEIFPQQKIGIFDNFFDLGGDSLLAIKLIYEVDQIFNRSFTSKMIFKSPTIHLLAKEIDDSEKTDDNLLDIVKIRNGLGENIYLGPGAGGSALSYINFANVYKGDNTLYAFEFPITSEYKLVYDTIQELATYYIKQIKKIQPEGRYNFVGYSFSGRLAFEIAIQLQKTGNEIGLLAIIDDYGINNLRISNPIINTILSEFHFLSKIHSTEKISYLKNRIGYLTNIFSKKSNLQKLASNNSQHVSQKWMSYEKILSKYRTKTKFRGDILLIKSENKIYNLYSHFYYLYTLIPDLYWSKNISGNIVIKSLFCEHLDFLSLGYVNETAQFISEYFQ